MLYIRHIESLNMKQTIFLLSILFWISSCSKKTKPTDILMRANGWQMSTMALKDTVFRTSYSPGNPPSYGYDILHFVYDKGNVVEFLKNLDFDSIDPTNGTVGLKVKYYKNNLVVKFLENGTFHVDLSRQLTGDSIVYISNGNQIINLSHTFTNPPNIETLEGTWEWSGNSSDKAVLYFHHPDFFKFVVGEDNLASSYFPFIVNKINDSELDLEFLNTFKTVDNTNGLYTEKSDFNGINKIYLLAK